MNPQRQEGPHAHSIYLSPDNRFAISADLGLDEVFVYRFDAAKGTLAPNNPPFAKVNPGAGPRHFAFHPSGKFGYVINEMQSTVTAFSYEPASGALHVLQTVSTLPQDFKGESYRRRSGSAPFREVSLWVQPRARLDCRVRDRPSKRDSHARCGTFPRWGRRRATLRSTQLARTCSRPTQDSDNIVLFRIDPKTGRLTPTGQVLEVPSPVCVTFVAIE